MDAVVQAAACFSPYFFTLKGTIISYFFEWHTQRAEGETP